MCIRDRPYSQELEEQYLAGNLLADLALKDSRPFRKELELSLIHISQNTSRQLRYLEEVRIPLHRAGFETLPLEGAQLPVLWNEMCIRDRDNRSCRSAGNR